MFGAVRVECGYVVINYVQQQSESDAVEENI